ncbi:probable E3 ubiquitin-protein ligase DTX3 [Myiozetetes cayanensis]|uniref:probable E3 ubiquitin-protein ligase DTX3 n=1 Tax=Myiozetetes cayanensis TaxID=478635 RepID=UPI0021609B90|nr:probable E3 ubiquitin-protein ligase DTX3 [Myiozetetes cayanensis]XP_050190758.1 probable E3 ubiquitin-protein ligase DTX3 [Myiozetetes cayanensis]
MFWGPILTPRGLHGAVRGSGAPPRSGGVVCGCFWGAVSAVPGSPLSGRGAPAVSFVLSRMSGCGGPAKSRVTVPKRVWEFVTRERAARLALLAQEARVRILVDGETPELYVLQLCATPPDPPGGLCPARKALKALLKETEKELKKRSGSNNNNHPHGHNPQHNPQHGHAEGPGGRAEPPAGAAGAPPAPAAGRDEEPERQCPICLGEMRGPRTLERCRHAFCGDCIARALQVRSACPVCGRFYGQLVGNQPPDGRMLVTRDHQLPLPGYEAFGTIIIQYVFPPGVQGVEHPNPGVRYPGTTRVAYLPDCPEGNKVLGLFRKAFAQRLTFTVGTSLTTGRANVITWNDIHHKTNCTGGPQLFGYPDPTYLARVQEELRAKGITED